MSFSSASFVAVFRRCLFVAGLLVVGAAAPAAEAPAPLTDIGEIRALPPERAAEDLPVHIRGVITRVTPHELFIQEGPEAIFVWRRNDPALAMGDYVEIRGLTHSGHFFPMIKEAEVTVLERRPLPPPLVLRPGELASARGDCQWVEIAGTVQTTEPRPGGALGLRVLYEDSLLRVEFTDPVESLSVQLIGARVRVRGVVSGFKTPQRRLTEPVLWSVLRPETFLVEAPGPADLFATPLTPLAALHAQSTGARSGELVRVAGTVTAQSAPDLVFVQDADRSLEIRLQQAARFVPGDRIEAVGFPGMGLAQAVLQSAFARRTAAGPPPVPRPLRAGELLDFRHEAALVGVTGELREIFRHHEGLAMLVAADGQAFSVDVAGSLLDSRTELPPAGSRISLVGICSIDRVTPPDTNQIVSPASVRLRLRSFDDLRVLSRPPWWTPQRLLAAVALLSLFALGALGWIWTLNRRVHAQTRIILGNAQKEAMLEERNRIAREFHDTLEQQLAGATILLDAIDTVVVEQPQRARDGLNTARAMLRHSLDEAQQAVADLHNNDLIEHDLDALIRQAVRERIAASGIRSEFRCTGTWPELDTMVKKHLLRMVQESVTNAVKHAAPSCITVSLHAAPDRVELQVADDGCGFSVQDRVRRGPGEFGLIGLQERAEKIGARLAIHSVPGSGTTVTVILPLTASTHV